MAGYSSLKSRFVWLTEADWCNFDRLLRETFPTIRYYVDLVWKHRYDEQRPDIPIFEKLLDIPSLYSEDCVFVSGIFNDAWRPDLRREPEDGEPDCMAWRIANRPGNPHFLFQMLRRLYTPDMLKDAPFMEYGNVTFYRDPGNHEHDLLSRHFYRLLGKICTNRNQVQISMPERKILFRQPKSSMFWLGQDALRWVREDPQRVFFYNDRKWAILPADAAPAG